MQSSCTEIGSDCVTPLAAILDNDAERYATLLEDVLVGSVHLGSQQRFDEALTLFKQEMPPSWLLVDCIRQLAEQYGLKQEA